ncbi:MAG TPA: phosphodiester glycosidase family protein [Planktothrix sp.]
MLKQVQQVTKSQESSQEKPQEKATDTEVTKTASVPSSADWTSLFARPSPPTLVRKPGKPVQFVKKTLNSTPLYETIVDLNDADQYVTIALANDANQANTNGNSHGDEAFQSLVRKSHAAVVLNGTFFSKDDEKRVMGNMVAGGRFLKYSRWENMGTTIGIRENNKLEMVTARDAEKQPEWREHWFSITCGPRLLKKGEVWIEPEKEGFHNAHVLGIGPRVAMGFNVKGDKLILVVFVNGLSLQGEAELMKQLGCSDAMNLDGGASRAVAYNGKIIMPAGRPLTNVIEVYDIKHPAPAEVVQSWAAFQKGVRTSPPEAVAAHMNLPFKF